MNVPQRLVVLSLEGVLFPDTWDTLAQKLALPDLPLPDSDYDETIRRRVEYLVSAEVSLADLCSALQDVPPLPGAVVFLDSLRATFPVVVLSDTFEQFTSPLSTVMHHPLVLCHRLVVRDDRVVGHKLRMPDHKRVAVESFQNMKYHVIAVGCSLNDLAMLHAADQGILMNPPPTLSTAHPRFPVCTTFDGLAALLRSPSPTP